MCTLQVSIGTFGSISDWNGIAICGHPSLQLTCWTMSLIVLWFSRFKIVKALWFLMLTYVGKKSCNVLHAYRRRNSTLGSIDSEKVLCVMLYNLINMNDSVTQRLMQPLSWTKNQVGIGRLYCFYIWQQCGTTKTLSPVLWSIIQEGC